MAKEIMVATFSVDKFSVSQDMSYDEMLECFTNFWEERFQKVSWHKPDLIVMPECSNRPSAGLMGDNLFDYYEKTGSQTLDFISATAKKQSCYIVYNQARKFDGKWYNTTTVFGRDGYECGCYRKNFLTPDEHTENKMQYGQDAPIIETDFGRLACITCFDLNYSELRERYRAEKPDLLVFSSMYHGGAEQTIWSWLCKCHFVGSMGSRVIPGEIRNPFGEVLYSTSNYFDYICGKINLDYQIVHLDNNWAKLDELKIKYGSDVTVYDPGYYGCVLITSNSDKISSREMLKQFQIDNSETYLEKARQLRNKSITQK